MDNKQKSKKNGTQPLSDKKGTPPQKKFLEVKGSDKPKSVQKDAQKNPSSSQDKKKNKSHAKEEVIKPAESVTKKVKERLPNKKNLGPSGQQWDR